MTAKKRRVYLPRPGSVADQVCAYLREHPDEQLAWSDVFRIVGKTGGFEPREALMWCVRHQQLVMQRNARGHWRYAAGPALPATAGESARERALAWLKAGHFGTVRQVAAGIGAAMEATRPALKRAAAADPLVFRRRQGGQGGDVWGYGTMPPPVEAVRRLPSAGIVQQALAARSAIEAAWWPK